ncbi:hypothetical protein A4X13_0g7250 [Tilletia indica]|uniref:Uncharacterized protein n=1 Tax=Tilletia indica TaxID=43049 RepID=A0A177TAT8_9BASI|nr:hypothetical protein A4X13_0g7250 [Tilletia indica]
MSLGNLPNEVLLHILSFLLPKNLRSSRRNHVLTALLHSIGSANKHLRKVLIHHLSQHYQMFKAVDLGPVRSPATIAWLPLRVSPGEPSHSRYWWFYVGPDWDDLPSVHFQEAWLKRTQTVSIKSLAIDLRIRHFPRVLNPRLWNKLHVLQWVKSAAVLARIASSVTDLEALHIRMPSQSDEFSLLEVILSNNRKLKDVIIEVDSTLSPQFFPRAVLNLDACTTPGESYAKLDRFIVRAPSAEVQVVDDGPLLERLSNAQEVIVAAYKLKAFTSCWQWVLNLMLAAPRIEKLEVAAAVGNEDAFTAFVTLVTAHLPHLANLIVDLPEVDSRFLRFLDAPVLKYLHVRSATPFDEYGPCPPLHFPSLIFLNVWCSCPVAIRFATAGLPREAYLHSLNAEANDEDPYYDEFPLRLALVPAQHTTDSTPPGSPTLRFQSSARATSPPLPPLPLFMTELSQPATLDAPFEDSSSEDEDEQDGASIVFSNSEEQGFSAGGSHFLRRSPIPQRISKRTRRFT